MKGLSRIIKAGYINFKRGGLISWASIMNMSITLAVVTTLVLLQAVLNFSLEQVKDKVDVTIYFNVGAPEDKILNLKESLEKLPEVKFVNYTSASEALKLFRERHANDYSTIAALDEIKDNPLGAYLNVKAKEVSEYASIANFLKSDDALVLGSTNIIDKINYYQNKSVIERLNIIIAGANKLGFLVTLILIIICIINTFNTLRLTIYIAKEEIGVMRLVGASKNRVRGPFMIEGMIYGILSSVFVLALFVPITIWLGKNMTIFLGMNIYEFYISNIVQISLIVLLSGILLGVFSSFLAINRYINK